MTLQQTVSGNARVVAAYTPHLRPEMQDDDTEPVSGQNEAGRQRTGSMKSKAGFGSGTQG